jgi:hypothetical protein
MSELTRTTTKAKPNLSLSAGVSTSKEIVALVRDLAIAIFAILLLLFPTVFNGVLTKAGVKEGEFRSSGMGGKPF